MSVDSKHPLYSEFLADWQTMRDTYRGEHVVKEKGETYLPPTSGMRADGYPTVDSIGWRAYQAYKMRAVFHGFVDEAVRTLVGIMHHKPPTIELPESMEPMREDATTKGESLEMLLRRINENQLVEGRYGMLLDLPSTPVMGEVFPYIATYTARRILNWDDGRREELTRQTLNFVGLDESEFERTDDFEWEQQDKYRILILGEVDPNEGPQEGAVYQVAVYDERSSTFNENDLMTPTLRGNTLDEIPFVFVNSSDIVPEPDDPPLVNLANLSLAIYRGEADYRQSLFMQGQDTLVTIGDTAGDDGNPKSYRTGANASISVPSGGDAKFIGVDSQGLSEQREGLENDKKDAASLAGQLMDNTARGVESGDALQMRVSARTATLNEIALTGAFALQSILRIAAKWMGANPEEVVVTPNLDFADEKLEGKTLVEYMTAKSLGAPISLRSIHRLMQQRDLTEMEFDDEVAEIESEEPMLMGDGQATDDASPVPPPEDTGDGDDES